MALPIPQLKWGAHYHVGVAEIDDQHEQIASVVNDLCDCLRRRAPRQEMAPLVEALVHRASDHFAYEEGLMRKTDCPDYELHKAEHDFLIAQVLNFQEQHQAGMAQVDEAFLTYIKDWLRNHMLVADRRMSRHLRTLGLGPLEE
jgi:hemerythrin